MSKQELPDDPQERALELWNIWLEIKPEEDTASFPSTTALADEFDKATSTMDMWCEYLRPEWKGSIVDPRENNGYIDIGYGPLADIRKSGEHKDFLKQYSGETGYLYIVEHPHGFYKIGVADSPNRRFNRLQVSCPYELELYNYFLCENHKQIENALHKKFENKKAPASNEWFDLSKHDVEELEELLLDSTRRG